MLRWLASAVNVLEVAKCFSERDASMVRHSVIAHVFDADLRAQILASRRHLFRNTTQPGHVDALSCNFYLALEWPAVRHSNYPHAPVAHRSASTSPVPEYMLGIPELDATQERQ